MNDPIVITRSLVKRGWSDFEPKVIAGLLTGSAGAFLIPILANFGIHLTLIQANYAVVGCYFIGSYILPSAGTTVTRTMDTPTNGTTRHVESEAHSGAAVTTVTASTPIQAPAEPSVVHSIPVDDPAATRPSSFAESRWGVPSTTAVPPSGPLPLGTAGDGATEVYR